MLDRMRALLSLVEPRAMHSYLKLTAEEALVDCMRRFKNLPERHFPSVETLVRRHFQKDRSIPFEEQTKRVGAEIQ